jgi:hypothetical protein
MPRAGAECGNLAVVTFGEGNFIGLKTVLSVIDNLARPIMTMKMGLTTLSAFVLRHRKTSPPSVGEFYSAVREVIAARIARAMSGKLSAAEARLMIAEKQSAALRAQFAYMDAVAKGRAAAAWQAYFDVYQRAVDANRRRLAQRRWLWFWRGSRTRLGALFIGAVVLLSPQWGLAPRANAQEIDFDRIDKFESLGTGTLEVGAGPKVIVDDGEAHTVILTIWQADAETKVSWTSPDGNVARTTIVPGKGVQTFQTAGELKLEAIGEPAHEVQYGYVVLHLKKHKAGS